MYLYGNREDPLARLQYFDTDFRGLLIRISRVTPHASPPFYFKSVVGLIPPIFRSDFRDGVQQ